MSRYTRTYQMSINLLSLIFWCIFSNNFVNTVSTSKSAGMLQKHWLKDVDDDELRQMIEDANITEEQLNDPDQTSDIFQRLIFLSPKNLRRFMQVLREWDNLSQRVSKQTTDYYDIYNEVATLQDPSNKKMFIYTPKFCH
ncbi:unnamed protein product [Trichobilharzia szidati]|nr:unnamed protein product [Trichobilharzia szidati]